MYVSPIDQSLVQMIFHPKSEVESLKKYLINKNEKTSIINFIKYNLKQMIRIISNKFETIYIYKPSLTCSGPCSLLLHMLVLVQCGGVPPSWSCASFYFSLVKQIICLSGFFFEGNVIFVFLFYSKKFFLQTIFYITMRVKTRPCSCSEQCGKNED